MLGRSATRMRSATVIKISTVFGKTVRISAFLDKQSAYNASLTVSTASKGNSKVLSTTPAKTNSKKPLLRTPFATLLAQTTKFASMESAITKEFLVEWTKNKLWCSVEQQSSVSTSSATRSVSQHANKTKTA